MLEVNINEHLRTVEQQSLCALQRYLRSRCSRAPPSGAFYRCSGEERSISEEVTPERDCRELAGNPSTGITSNVPGNPDSTTPIDSTPQRMNLQLIPIALCYEHRKKEPEGSLPPSHKPAFGPYPVLPKGIFPSGLPTNILLCISGFAPTCYMPYKRLDLMFLIMSAPNIFLRTLFSNTLNLYSSLKIMMHSGNYDRYRNPVNKTSYKAGGIITIPPFWFDDR
ncbi:hypothetical protein ANN_11683 [Periplaneta americana]|uniref:Uncharacterized protein n=1 Tax=Periplaneta americana TaxID=6978 RepID=A0ABQ8T5Q2_PERAM|nr:hypothetical protein ANN_11683 [Periplaneta americana]